MKRVSGRYVYYQPSLVGAASLVGVLAELQAHSFTPALSVEDH